MANDLRHAYADVDGLRLHWAELGEHTSQTPLVLLHGIADSHLSWHPVAAGLARDRLVLMPDLPGCGLSGRPDASYELSWQTRTIAHWLAQRGFGSYDIIGHSYGGGVAQMLVLECPERIRRVILVASGGLGRGLGFWLKFASFPRAVEQWGQPFMAFGTRRSLRAAHEASDQRDVLQLAEMNAKPGSARAFSRMVRDVIDWRGQTRMFLQHAYEIEVFPPIAVFWGERDQLIPIAQGEAFVGLMRGVQLQRFAGSGHFVHRDEPQAFVQAALAFLDDPNVQPARLPKQVAELPTRAARTGPLQQALRAAQGLRARLLSARKPQGALDARRASRASEDSVPTG